MLGLFQRKDRLIVHGKAPYNAEPPLDRLRAAFLTEQADFYVRSHGDIPDLDADSYRLTVDGMVTMPLDSPSRTQGALCARHRHGGDAMRRQQTGRHAGRGAGLR